MGDERQIVGGWRAALTSFLIAFGILWAHAAWAGDMDFAVRQQDLRPNLDLSQWIVADGDIVPSTPEKFQAFVKAHPELVGGATVVLNSPGGSPYHGMLLGEAIRAAHFRTDVATMAPGSFGLLPGQCMSACIFPYLGGEYRYLAGGSALGIHRFRFSKDFGGSVTSEVSQELSGQIVSFIQQSRADPAMFALMTKTPPDDIRILSADEVKRLKIVTGDVRSEEWSFEVRATGSYLKAEQQTWRGENKLLFLCMNAKGRPTPAMMALSEVPDAARVVEDAKDVILFVNGKGTKIPPELIADPPKVSNADVAWTILLTPDLANAVKAADAIGGGISAAPGSFAGFIGIAVGDGREKLTRTLTECGAPASLAASPEPRAASKRLDDAGLPQRVARNFSTQYKKGGMTAARASVEACYARASTLGKLESVEYCYLLDQAASLVDASAMRQLGIQQDAYWQEQTATNRTAMAMFALKIDPEKAAAIVRTWVPARGATLMQLLALQGPAGQRR